MKDVNDDWIYEIIVVMLIPYAIMAYNPLTYPLPYNILPSSILPIPVAV